MTCNYFFNVNRNLINVCVLQSVCFFMDSRMALCYDSESHISMLASFPHGSSYEKIVCTDFKVIFKMYTIKHQFSYFYV